MTRQLTLARSFTVAASGDATVTKKTMKDFTVAAEGDAALRIEMSEEILERIESGGEGTARKFWHLEG